MGINSTDTAYNFGQLGSAYTSGSDAIVPPTDKVFIAITMLADTVFKSSGGLVAERVVVPGATASDLPTRTGDIYISTEQPAHDLVGSSETTTEGSGGQVVDSVSFPLGITIYGRWNKIDILSGSIVAYIGE